MNMNSLSSASPEPKLQPPGAGLPLPQKLLLRFWLGPVVSRRTDPSKSREDYERLIHKLIEKISAVPEEKRRIKVLVDPIQGLEDSSRYWSLNDLMEHLLIVSKGIEVMILSLSSGKVPDVKADVAKVKPTNADQDFYDAFTAYAPNLIRRIDQKLAGPGMNFDSRLRARHPWLGMLTARQWYWLLGSHTSIHYRQAKEIIRKL